MGILNSNLTVERCLFYRNNSSMKGGGLICTDSNLDLVNCTFQGNGSTLGGSVYIHHSVVNFKNTIVEGTTGGGGVYFRLSSNAAVSYCDFYNNGSNFAGTYPAGAGTITSVNANGDSCDTYCNIFLEPDFMNIYRRDFRLTAHSPCIDAGDPATPLDPDSTVADIGAFIFDHNTAAPGIELSADTLRFPDTWIDSTRSLFLTIRNPGQMDLILREMNFSGASVFSADWNPSDSLVLPGDSLTLTIFFTPPEAAFYEGTLTIDNNAATVSAALQGTGIAQGVRDGAISGAPVEFKLWPPSPNPFNPQTIIRFSLPEAGRVNLSIYDISGREAVRLVDEELARGTHQAAFDGSSLASGIYFANLRCGEHCAVKKLLLVK